MNSIVQFIDSFWKPPIMVDFDPETYPAYLDSLKDKYGHDAIEQYKEEASMGGTQNIFDIIFKNDMLDDVFPYAALRGRKTLGSLLKHLEKREQQFTIFDAGSGDGMITIGLATYLDNLEKVYAMDLSPYAMPLLEKNLSKLPNEYRRKAEKKLVLHTGSFRSEQDLQIVSEEVDVGLIAYPSDLNGAEDGISNVLKKGGDVIIGVDTSIPEHFDKSDKESMEGLAQTIIYEMGQHPNYCKISYDLFDCGTVGINPEMLFILGIGNLSNINLGSFINHQYY